MEEIQKFYTDYDSPYRLKIREELNKQKIPAIDPLPQIVTKIGDAFKDQIDEIVNVAIANSYVPKLRDLLRLYDKEVKMSFILQEIINALHATTNDMDNFSFSYEENQRFEWLACELKVAGEVYKFTLHKNDNMYKLLSLGYGRLAERDMELAKDDIRLTMPMQSNILNDEVNLILTKLLLGNTLIDMDCDDFEEEMFEDIQEC